MDQIRAARGVGATREEGLKIIEAEAHRIKITAEYPNRINETLQRRSSHEILDESDYEDDDMSDNSEQEWMKEASEEDSASHQPVIGLLRPRPSEDLVVAWKSHGDATVQGDEEGPGQRVLYAVSSSPSASQKSAATAWTEPQVLFPNM